MTLTFEVYKDSVPTGQLDQLAECYAACFSEPQWNEVWTAATAADALRAKLVPGSIAIAAIRDGEFAGFALGLPAAALDRRRTDSLAELGIALDETFYIAELAVSKEHRKQGVGSALLNEMADRARPTWPNLVARTNLGMTKVIALFGQAGYSQIGTAEGVSGGKTATRVVLINKG